MKLYTKKISRCFECSNHYTSREDVKGNGTVTWEDFCLLLTAGSEKIKNLPGYREKIPRSCHLPKEPKTGLRLLTSVIHTCDECPYDFKRKYCVVLTGGKNFIKYRGETNTIPSWCHLSDVT